MRANFLTINSALTRYFSAGAGHPVLLVHGVGVGADCWLRNIEALAARHTVVAPDFLGSTFSGEGTYTGGPPQNHIVEHLFALMDNLGHRRFSVIGNSFGSQIVTLMYLAKPDRIDRVALVGCGPSLNTVESQRGIYERSLANGRKAFENPTKEVCTRRFANLVHDPRSIPMEIIHTELTAFALPDALDRYLRRMTGIVESLDVPRYDVFGRLEELRCETLVVWGKQDPRGDYAEAVEASRRISRGRFVCYDDCGHFPQIEHADRFNQDALAFLEAPAVRELA